MAGFFLAKRAVADRWIARPLAALALIGLLLPGLAAAQDAPTANADAPGLIVELNRIDELGGACQMTFVASNGLDRDIDPFALEVVLFDDDGLVDQITVFGFGLVEAGRTVVRQFEIPNTSCGRFGRILVNGVASCQANGLNPGVCQSLLRTRSRADLAFGF